MVLSKRLGAVATVIGLASVGAMAMPQAAHAWWRGGGYGVGVWVPPVVVAPRVYPAPIYAPPYPPPIYGRPPIAYAGPRRPWIPPHWRGPYWVPGHWG